MCRVRDCSSRHGQIRSVHSYDTPLVDDPLQTSEIHCFDSVQRREVCSSKADSSHLPYPMISVMPSSVLCSGGKDVMGSISRCIKKKKRSDAKHKG